MSNDLKKLQQLTQARVALTRSGNSISTQEILKFNEDCAMARDAVHAVWNINAIKENCHEECIQVKTVISDRNEYLKRPDLGRVLTNESREALTKIKNNYDVVFIVSDGLSATAIEKHFIPLWSHIKKLLLPYHLKIAPIILAPFSRVALSDEIGFYLNAKVSIIFIGERPGLTASDSLGIYLTYAPKPGNTDSNRNCISNIRPPDGLSYEVATKKLIYLLIESMKLKLSGIILKEKES
jgi:ethanolamine ammonia-lyase small subunit